LPDEPISSFPSNIRRLITEKFEGNVAAMGRVIGATRRTTKDWAEGKLRPSLTTLLLLQQGFGVRAGDWITNTVSIADLSETQPVEKALRVHMRKIPRKLTHEAIETGIRQILQRNQFPPPSLRAICRELGFHQTTAVRHCPDLAKQVIDNFKHFMR